MKYFDKMYVGFQRDRYADTDRILGFAVPYGETVAEKKRMQTVDSWRQKDVPTRILDNTPTRGFKLADVVSRYSTSNKLFRVVDPRGFELEISSENLFKLLGECTFVKGEIIDDCVWTGGHNGKICLVQQNDIGYQNHIKNKNKKTQIVEGGVYVGPNSSMVVFRFEGIFDTTSIEKTHIATQYKYTAGEFESGYRFHHRTLTPHRFDVSGYKTEVDILLNEGKSKRVHVYSELFKDDDGKVVCRTVHVRKGHMKNLVDYSMDDVEDFKNMPAFDYQYYNVNRKSKHLKEEISRYNDGTTKCSIRGESVCFFKTKDEARDFEYDDILKHSGPIKDSGYIIPVRSKEKYSRLYDQIVIDHESVEYRENSYYGYRNRYEVRLSPDVKHTTEVNDLR